MTGSPRDEPATRWAAEELGVAAGAAPDVVRGAFLRRLAETDFVPPPAALRAYRHLAEGRPLRAENACAEHVLLAEEDRLRTEVEDFAEQFFTLAPPERRQRWLALTERCRWSPPLAARLLGLEAGLGVDLSEVPDADPLAARLARQVGELFVLRPADRAQRRRAFLARMGGEADAWERAARRLDESHPAVASLAPELLDRLMEWSATQKELARARKRPRRGASAAGTSGPSGGSGGGRFPWYVIFFIIMGLSWLVRSADRRPAPAPSYDRFRPPAEDFPNWQPGGAHFDKDWQRELEKLRKKIPPPRRPGAWPPPQGQPGLDKQGENRPPPPAEDVPRANEK
jgi:hypothetical protein